MSFDLYYFRPKPGVTLEESAQFFLRESEEDEDEDIEGPFDPALGTAEITGSVIASAIPPDKRSAALAAWLAKHEAGTADESDLHEIEDAQGFIEEWMDIGIKGVWMSAFSYGGDLSRIIPGMCGAVRGLAPRNIHIFDPQAGCVIPSDEPERHFEDSIKASEDFHQQAISQLMGDQEDTFDLYFFRLGKGAGIDAALDYLETGGEPLESGGSPPVDPDLTEEDLIRIGAGPALAKALPPEERSEDLQAWLDAELDGTQAELDPLEVEEINAAFGAWDRADVAGVYVKSFRYTPGLAGISLILGEFTRAVAPHSIFVADPQAGCVVPPDDPEGHLSQSIQAALADRQVSSEETDDDEDEDDEE